MRLDRSGRPITASASNIRCQVCDIPFAAGHLPRDQVMICRDCRAEAAEPDGPTLALVIDNTADRDSWA